MRCGTTKTHRCLGNDKTEGKDSRPSSMLSIGSIRVYAVNGQTSWVPGNAEDPCPHCRLSTSGSL